MSNIKIEIELLVTKAKNPKLYASINWVSELDKLLKIKRTNND